MLGFFMLVMHQNYTNQSAGSLATREAGVKNSAKIVFTILTGMVKDKVSYPIRELATNAYEVSPERIDIELPTTWVPTFRIRDYGPGLSHRFMMERYATIGDSTKDDDANAIGGFGYGSKSPLAYLIRDDEGAGSYTVRSFQKGRVRTYNIGLTPKGSILVEQFGDDPTDDPPGLEVSFPVRRDDVAAFRDRAATVLWSFHPWPSISPKPDWKEPKVLAKGNGWTLYDPNTVPWRGPHVRMGAPLYPIDLGQVPRSSFLLSSDCLLFDAPIGSLTVQTSRENLTYGDRTKSTLTRLISDYEADYAATVTTKIATAPDFFTACADFEDATSNLGYNRQDVLRQKTFWKGLPIIDKLPERAMVLSNGWKTAERYDADNVVRPQACIGRTLVIEHNPYASFERLEAAGLTGKSIVWVRIKRPQLAKFLASIGNPPHTILDTFKVAPRPKTILKKRRAVIFLGNGKHFHCDSEPFDFNAGGLYVDKGGSRRSSYFTVALGRNMTESQFNDLLKIMTSLGMTEHTIMVRNNGDQLDPNKWFWLGDYLDIRLRDRIDRAQINAPLKDKSLYQLPSDLRKIGTNQFGAFATAPEPLHLLAKEARALCTKLKNGAPNTETESDRAYQALRLFAKVDDLGAPDCPIETLEKKLKGYFKEYPLLEPLLNACSYYDSAGNHHIIHYWNLLSSLKGTEQ